MNKLSVIILTHNDESIIADCMDSVSFADEIIIVDDGSLDRTTEVAKLLGARIYEFSHESFSEKRTFGLKRAKYKWVLYIDSDERVTPELKSAITEVLKLKKAEFAGYRLQRKNFYLGNHEWPQIESLARLFDRDAIERWNGNVHETAVVNGSIGTLPGYIYHYTHQELASMVDKTIEWSKIEADLRYHSHHPRMSGWRFFRVMLTAFFDSFLKQKGWKAGTAGVVESVYQAFSMYITYARLWELQLQAKSEK